MSDADCGCLETRIGSKNSAKLCLAKMFSVVGVGIQDSCGSASSGLTWHVGSDLSNTLFRLGKSISGADFGLQGHLSRQINIGQI